MSVSDEDVPPPLESIPQQVEALVKKSSNSCKSESRSSTVKTRPQNSSGLKKGFLCKSTSKTQKIAEEEPEEIPVIRSNGNSREQQVPDFLRVPGVEEYTKLKNDMIAKLSPTKETVENIQKDPFLAQAFSDPEIMKAVGDVASNPRAYEKHRNNKKVVKFYEAFGKIIGQKLQS